MAAAMLVGSSTTAFAYVDPSAENAAEGNVAEEPVTADEGTQPEGTGAVLEESDQTGTAFSVPGNGEVLDDFTDDPSKEFLTVTTKNNQTFYIVIDRSASSDNVYMLSQIDENDLKEFLDEAEKSETPVTPSIVLEENQDDKEEPENWGTPEEEESREPEKSGTNTGMMAVILLAAAAGIGGYYYFKIYKPKSQDSDTDNEGLEIDDGLETVDESDEDMDEYEDF